MPGYNPNCPNCHRCPKCRGDGTVYIVKYVNNKEDKRRETCPSCNGVGGRVGVGPHDHR